MAGFSGSTYGAAAGYTDESLIGGGAIKGKNCTISKIEKIDDVNVVTFSWTLDDGTVKQGTMSVKDGATPISATIDADNHIVFTMSDGRTIDCGELPKQKIEISKESGNVLEKKDDGLFVPKGAVEVSKKDGNIIKAEADGLYAKADTIEISKAEKNILKQNDDGLYVPETDLSDYVEKEENKSLVLDSDIEQISTNKTAIEVLNGDAETEGSVDKKLADAIATLNKLEKKILDHIPTVEEAKDNVLYMVESETAGTYNQYMLIDGTIANLGSTEVDLDGYAKLEDVIKLQQQIVDKGKVLVVGEDGKVVLQTLAIPTKVEDLEDAEDYAKVEALDDYVTIAQGEEYKGKALIVDDEGNVAPSDIEIESPSWTGTKAEFEALDKSTLKDGQQVNITDDSDKSLIDDSKTTAENVWSAMKVNSSLVDLKVTKLYRTDDGAIADANLAVCQNHTEQWWATSNSTTHTPKATWGSIRAVRTGSWIKQYWRENGSNAEYMRTIEVDANDVYSTTVADWQELATMDKMKNGYAKIIKNSDTDTDDAMFIAYKNSELFGVRIYKNDDSEHELRFSASGISYIKNGATIWTK